MSSGSFFPIISDSVCEEILTQIEAGSLCEHIFLYGPLYQLCLVHGLFAAFLHGMSSS